MKRCTLGLALLVLSGCKGEDPATSRLAIGSSVILSNHGLHVDSYDAIEKYPVGTEAIVISDEDPLDKSGIRFVTLKLTNSNKKYPITLVDRKFIHKITKP